MGAGKPSSRIKLLAYPRLETEWAEDDNVGAYMHFASRLFENTHDDRSQASTSGKGKAGSIHQIILPYPNVISSESSQWKEDMNPTWDVTDADTRGAYDRGDLNYAGRLTEMDEVEMELSMAGFKQATLRQRHYSWNLVNREPGDGEQIAKICRNFQAAVYPALAGGFVISGYQGFVGNEHVMPPPMFTVSLYFPSPGKHGGTSTSANDWVVPNEVDPVWDEPFTGSGNPWDFDDHSNNYPISVPGSASHTGWHTGDQQIGRHHGQWRWHLDHFDAVCIKAEISPTKSTDGLMVRSGDGFPLVTQLNLSFMEVSSVVANNDWTHLIPYSFATDAQTPGYNGWGGAFSPL